MYSDCDVPKLLTQSICVLLLLLVASPASSQYKTEYVPGEHLAQSEDELLGWNGSLKLGANVNITSNKDVVGQVDGFSSLVGLAINGGLDFIDGRHELRNVLKIDESWARTPTIEQFVKNNDTINLESIYNYFLVDWAGGYGRFNFESTLFETQRVTAEPQTYEIEFADGTTQTRQDIREFTLSDPFQPTTFSESIGAFVEPIREETFTLSSRLGFGARETLADGVLSVDADDGTDVVEIKELENIYQAGLEGFLGMRGKLQDGRIGYDVGAIALVPFINNDPENRDAIDLTRIGVTGSVNFNIVEWMSASYNLKVTDDPQLTDKVQITNNLLLTLSYSLIERQAPEVSLQEKLEKAREEAEAAREKVESLEEKAAEREGEQEESEEGEGEGEGETAE